MAKKKKDKSKDIDRLEIRRELGILEAPRNAYEAKGQTNQSAMLAVRDIAIGGLLGGLAGSAVGRWSPLVGLAAAGLAYYAGSPGLAGVGIGIALGGLMTYKTADTANERMKAFVSGLKEAFQFAKTKQTQDPPTSEPREEPEILQGKAPRTVEHFPDTVSGPEAENTAADPLAEIEQQIIAEAVRFQRENGVQPVNGAGENSLFDEDDDFEDEETGDEDDFDQPDHEAGSDQGASRSAQDKAFARELEALDKEPDFDFL